MCRQRASLRYNSVVDREQIGKPNWACVASEVIETTIVKCQVTACGRCLVGLLRISVLKRRALGMVPRFGYMKSWMVKKCAITSAKKANCSALLLPSRYSLAEEAELTT